MKSREKADNKQQVKKKITNSTINEFFNELEKVKIGIVDLVREKYQTIEYVISEYGDFLGFNMFLSAKNMELCLKNRVYESSAVIEGYFIVNNSKTEIKFPLDRDLSWEIWSSVKELLKVSGLIAKRYNA